MMGTAACRIPLTVHAAYQAKAEEIGGSVKAAYGTKKYASLAVNQMAHYREENVRGIAAMGLDPYFAVGRQEHVASATESLAATDAPATTCTTAAVADENRKAAMASKLRVPTGRAVDATRKHIA